MGAFKKKIDIKELQKKIDQKDSPKDIPSSNEDSIKAVAMIRSYRQRGHLIAKLDPLGLLESNYLEELHPESFGLKKKIIKRKFI